MSAIKKSVSPEGIIDLKFKTKGARVGSHLFMPLFFVFALLPVSCTVSAPVAFLTFNKEATRQAFPAGTAFLWVLLTLFIWGGVVYAYNHRRVRRVGTMRIVPKESVYTNFLYEFEKGKNFVVKSDTSLGFANDIWFVAFSGNHGDGRITDYMSEEQATELVNLINTNR